MPILLRVQRSVRDYAGGNRVGIDAHLDRLIHLPIELIDVVLAQSVTSPASGARWSSDHAWSLVKIE